MLMPIDAVSVAAASAARTGTEDRSDVVSLMSATLVIEVKWRYICHFKST